MAKKKKLQLSGYCDFVAMLFGVAAFCMMFLTCVKYTGIISNYDFTGYQIAFGYAEKSGSVSVQMLAFSFMNLLPYILVLVGIFATALCAFGKRSSGLLGIIAFAAFVVAAVFFFLAANFIVLPESAILTKENFSLAVGSILSGSFSIVAALCFVAKKFL